MKHELATETIRECNSLYRLAEDTAAQAKDLAERAAHYAVLLGIRLKQLKVEAPHGSWEPLFDENGKSETSFRFSVRTARNYIKAAESVLSRKCVSDRDKKAITTLALEEPQLSDTDHALLNKATNSQTLQQLYLDFGIIRRTTPPIPTKKQGGETEKKQTPAAEKNIDQGDAAETYRLALHGLDKAVACGLHLHLHPSTAEELIDALKGHTDTLKGLIQ